MEVEFDWTAGLPSVEDGKDEASSQCKALLKISYPKLAQTPV
jgi:hypothetical protein